MEPTRKDSQARRSRAYLGVYFVNCRVYGRLYRNRIRDGYSGMCPRCGTSYRVRIGPGGIDERFLKAFC